MSRLTIHFLLVTILGLLSVGCASTNVSKLSATTGALSKTIVATPSVEWGEKISGEATVTKILGGLIVLGDTKYADGVRYSTSVETQEKGFLGTLASLFGGESHARAKAAAAYEACQSSGADIILYPSYVVDETNYILLSTTKCQVTGFKGTITGIKEIETKDYLELQVKHMNEEPDVLTRVLPYVVMGAIIFAVL
jgi:hypothetical protein